MNCGTSLLVLFANFRVNLNDGMGFWDCLIFLLDMRDGTIYAGNWKSEYNSRTFVTKKIIHFYETVPEIIYSWISFPLVFVRLSKPCYIVYFLSRISYRYYFFSWTRVEIPKNM